MLQKALIINRKCNNVTCYIKKKCIKNKNAKYFCNICNMLQKELIINRKCNKIDKC